MEGRVRVTISPNSLKNEFKNLFVGNCGDKDRDMSICPNCEECPYFEGHEISFNEMVEVFIKTFRRKINEKISDTEYREVIKQFYQNYMSSKILP